MCPHLNPKPHAGLVSARPPCPQVREVYEQAIEGQAPYQLSDEDCRKMVLRYASLERQLGEIDRARAIFVHGSSLADPRIDRLYWHQWNEFEVKHGNEDTFREMLRIKRSVAASFTQMHVNAPVSGPGGAASAGAPHVVAAGCVVEGLVKFPLIWLRSASSCCILFVGFAVLLVQYLLSPSRLLAPRDDKVVLIL